VLSECHKYGLNQRNFLLAPLAALFCTPLHSQNDCANCCTENLGCPNWRSLATCLVGSQQTYFSAQGRHFYLSPLAVQKVTTPLAASVHLGAQSFYHICCRRIVCSIPHCSFRVTGTEMTFNSHALSSAMT